MGCLLFFTNFFWPVVGANVIKVVQHFLRHGLMLRSLNRTFVVLIIKRARASSFFQLRLISLGFRVRVYKVISKILANKIHPSLIILFLLINLPLFLEGGLVKILFY